MGLILLFNLLAALIELESIANGVHFPYFYSQLQFSNQSERMTIIIVFLLVYFIIVQLLAYS